MIIPYQQVLPDTCLPSCLMMALANLKKIEKPTFDLETEILIEGGKLGRLQRTFGHLLYVCRKFKTSATYVTDKPWVYDDVTKLIGKRDSNIRVTCRNIDANVIGEMVQKTPIIVGIDNFNFNRDFHFPHFVLVERATSDDQFEIIEPWQGKKLWISRAELNVAMEGLEQYLFYWKELVQIRTSES